MPANILIVDDDREIISSIKRMLKKEEYTIFSAIDGESGLEIIEGNDIDIALVDYQMPGMNGIELLKQLKEVSPEIEVIIITGYGTIQSAIEAMKLGAYDYITKPIDITELRRTLRHINEKQELIVENLRLREELRTKSSYNGIVGQSPSMVAMYRTIIKASERNTSVLIQGESGTGKEVVARAIHTASPRSAQPFVVIDCSSVSIQVIESELFGHVKGAFTNAFAAKKGLLEEAEGGTVFIDEVTEIPLDTQSTFLRVLQEREIRRVGSNRPTPIDVRVIAATNRNISQEIEQGQFRLDLFYRLNVIPIMVPPLKERLEDIPLLIRHFMEEFRTTQGQFESISREALAVLMGYPWPGNVRELRNVIERIFVLNRGETIETAHLPVELMEAVPPAKAMCSGKLSDIEKQAILHALKTADGDRIRAAKILDIGKSTLYRKLKTYGIA